MKSCHRFTTDSYVHAHDLGRVPCVVCGHRYQDHPGNGPEPSPNARPTPSAEMRASAARPGADTTEGDDSHA